MSEVDRRIIGIFQWIYDLLLDRFSLRIGTFRMWLAVLPVILDAAARAGRSSFYPHVASMIILLMILFFKFYDFKAMAFDNARQARNDLKPINLASCVFESRSFHIRVFYLGFFCAGAVFNHQIAGIGLLTIVFTRCVKVRERKLPYSEPRFALRPA